MKKAVILGAIFVSSLLSACSPEKADGIEGSDYLGITSASGNRYSESTYSDSPTVSGQTGQ